MVLLFFDANCSCRLRFKRFPSHVCDSPMRLSFEIQTCFNKRNPAMLAMMHAGMPKRRAVSSTMNCTVSSDKDGVLGGGGKYGAFTLLDIAACRVLSTVSGASAARPPQASLPSLPPRMGSMQLRPEMHASLITSPATGRCYARERMHCAHGPREQRCCEIGTESSDAAR